MTSADRAAFLAAILNEPAEDTHRLVYADALRESDDPHDRLLGRFIWSGVTLAQFRNLEPVGDGMFFDAIADQTASVPTVVAAQIESLFGWTWGPEIAWTNDDAAPDRITLRLLPPVVTGESTTARRLRRRHPGPEPSATWERGMLHTVRLPIAMWGERCGLILSNCPVQCVELLEVPGLVIHVTDRLEHGWTLFAELNLPRVPAHPSVIAVPAVMLTRTHWSNSAPKHDRAMLVRNAWDWTDVLLTRLQQDAAHRWPGPADWPEPPDVPLAQPGEPFGA